MPLTQLYKLWGASSLISLLICTVYIAIAYKVTSNGRETAGDDFALLPHLLLAHILFILFTGVLVSAFIRLYKVHGHLSKRLSLWILLLYLLVVVIAVILLNFAWIYYFNPFAFVLTASFPYIGWLLINPTKNIKPLLITGIFFLAFAFYSALLIYNVLNSGPALNL